MSPPLDVAHSMRERRANYPFLVQHIPEEIRDKDTASASSRQKRRRTSPQDHALLEAAYQRNSKPNKHERHEIVSQVDLGEKEVQIWFQNRRQTDRRKSRPLLPYELVPHFRNSIPIEVLQHSPHVNHIDHEALQHPPPASSQDYTEPEAHSQPSNTNEPLNTSLSFESKTSTPASGTQERKDNEASPLSSFEQVAKSSRFVSANLSSDARPEHDDTTSSGRKRAHAEMTGSTSVPREVVTEGCPESTSQGSTVRLSMTAEGAVKIRTSEQETPSPAKERAIPLNLSPRRRNSTLQRSKSAIGTSGGGGQSSPLLANFNIADGKLGRSRDARTWEFYCDSEARDSLSSHAEHESNGSAVGAINLIRSQSQRHLRQMLAPVTARNNPKAPATLGSTGQRSRAKLVRAKSSLGRLQAVDVDLRKMDDKRLSPSLVRSPSGDSDKENWAPGTHVSQHALRRTEASFNGRPVLTSNDSVLSSASAFDREGRMGNRKSDRKGDMVSLAASSQDKGSDLDCVQGLLSLSQGAWR